MKILALNLLMRVFSWVSPRMGIYLAPPVAALLWYLSPRKRRATRLNLRAVYPHYDAERRNQIARASMVHYVRGAFEAGMLWYWPIEKTLACFDPPKGLEVLRAAQHTGKGVIIAVPHSGAWELLNIYVQHQLQSTVLYKPGRHVDIDALLVEKRQRSGGKAVPANAAGLRALFKTIKAGGEVGILPDQEPTRGAGEFAPFFGIETLTGVLLPRIARRTGASVVFAVCIRNTNGRYCVHYLAADPAIASEDSRTALTAMNAGVERTVEIDTEQYLWAYKRFRNRPEGERSFYKSGRVE